MGLRPSLYHLSTIASIVCSACWQRVEIFWTKSWKCSWSIKILVLFGSENFKNFTADRVLPTVYSLKLESYCFKKLSSFFFDTFPMWGKWLSNIPHWLSGRDFFQSAVVWCTDADSILKLEKYKGLLHIAKRKKNVFWIGSCWDLSWPELAFCTSSGSLMQERPLSDIFLFYFALFTVHNSLKLVSRRMLSDETWMSIFWRRSFHSSS